MAEIMPITATVIIISVKVKARCEEFIINIVVCMEYQGMAHQQECLLFLKITDTL